MEKETEGLLQGLMAALPAQLCSFKSELESSFRPLLHEAMRDMPWITRLEFEAQLEVLKRSRLRLEAVLAKLEALEAAED